ncbi:MAG: Ldh family oxidoreductase, partial [Chloroflexi bacterium]|nr:Ldh family oxidoreductase [Chloroflexota bacterium]
MPIIAHDQLQGFIARLLKAAGASAEESGIVARHSVAANLAGHDSHGVIQVPVYIDRIKRGHIVPGAPFEVKRETATTLVVDGNWGFGYVVSERAMKMVIEKAKKSGIAAATVSRQSHVGRLTDYPLMASAEGLMGMMTADSGRSPKNVAPFGGRLNRLGTNPLCMAMPSNLEAPLYFDFATSAVAAGKITLAAARNQPIPQGWILDKDGKPSTNPNDLANGGAQLPLGGSEGHKGYGLSVMVEILSGILTGLGFGHEPSGKHNDGCFMAAFDVGAFRDTDEFKQEVTEFAQYLKETPPAE